MEMQMEIAVEQLREYFRSGETKSASWRRSQLKALLKLVQDREGDLFRALNKDLGKPPAESYRDEIGLIKREINATLDNLEWWMSGKKVSFFLVQYIQQQAQYIPLRAEVWEVQMYASLPCVNERMFPMTQADLVPQPLGLVLIISSWNIPLGLALQPLVGAIAAGNTAVLKPSELASAVSSLLAESISTYLDTNAVKVIQGGPDVASLLLELKWDHIFFTGSRRVGSIVMAAAAKHLTPVTLELGGKCPTILDGFDKLSSRERTMALKRVLSAKFGTCSGQACIAIDYILVEEKFAPKLIELLKEMTSKMFGEGQRELDCTMTKIAHQNFMRLKRLLDEPGVRSCIVYGGFMDENSLLMGPTILVNPPLDAEIMKEEIFGPLLPIITVKNIEESIGFINARPKPLALYCFTKSAHLKKRITAETSSGSLVFNDTVVQYAVDTIPFGGVGESGFGRYHGKFGFDTFSHSKPVIHRNYLVDFWFRYPPWRGYQLQLFRSFYADDYLSVLLVTLGFKKAPPLPKI